jgi:uncharacterized BrkB/YihY/UPF0761 family membrane protein
MKVKLAFKGALFSTVLIYLLLGIFLIIINLMNRFGVGYSIITIISLSLVVLYYANYIIIVGMVINHKRYKKLSLE